tara:strand:- start:864 stop:1685 length:822 start_codon:yes stop_codon:yes gene_type:complete
MRSNIPIAVIGGYDAISMSFFSKARLLNNKSIFINVNNKKIIKDRVFNYKIFELKKILKKLNEYRIQNLIFLGKIIRPNLSDFKADGEIDKYIPLLIKSYMQGDGKVLYSVLSIFTKKGYKVLSPRKISSSFFLEKDELNFNMINNDKTDISKSIKLLNDLSKYDNAQSLVCVNGYIIAIEAAEGTDSLLVRSASIRRKIKQIDNKAGLLTKIPKKNQSKLVDLPVIGVKTLKLIKKANLNGLAINPKYTIIHNKKNFLAFAYSNNLKIYSVI